MTGIVGLGQGLLNMFQQPQSQSGLLGDTTDRESLARALEWRQSVMSKDSPQTEMDKRASWYAAAGYTPQDIRGGLLGVMTSPTQIAKAQEWASLAPFGITAYHGSPHRFEKFDISKIGTGEGAQAYGHGLYFAENPAVAQEYKRALSSRKDATLRVLNDSADIPQWLAHRINETPAGIDNAISEWTTRIAEMRGGISSGKDLQPWITEGNITNLSKQLAVMQKAKQMGQVSAELPGALYKVDIPDEHIAKMLDWDKPLSQQPEILAKLRKFVGDNPEVQDILPRITGAELHNNILPMIGVGRGGPGGYAHDMAADFLRQQGIPGIRYLDQGSRGAGQGTSNFVVFDPAIAKILERR